MIKELGDKPLKDIKKLGERTLYIRGSPATLIYISDNCVYVVDPGVGSKRAKKLRSIIRSLNKDRIMCLLTHYHSDHIAIAEKIGCSEIWASHQDSLFIKDPVLRNYMTYGYPFIASKYFLYNAPSVKVTHVLNAPCKIGELEILHLPGHTLGQIGVLTDDSVAYLADSFFGRKVLEYAGIPYHFNPLLALNTLEYVKEEIVRDIETLVISHGPILNREEGKSLIEENKHRIMKIVNIVLDELSKSPTSIAKITLKVLRALNANISHTSLMLGMVFMKSLLASLEEQGKTEPIISNEGLLWKRT